MSRSCVALARISDVIMRMWSDPLQQARESQVLTSSTSRASLSTSRDPSSPASTADAATARWEVQREAPFLLISLCKGFYDLPTDVVNVLGRVDDTQGVAGYGPGADHSAGAHDEPQQGGDGARCLGAVLHHSRIVAAEPGRLVVINVAKQYGYIICVSALSLAGWLTWSWTCRWRRGGPPTPRPSTCRPGSCKRIGSVSSLAS